MSLKRLIYKKKSVRIIRTLYNSKKNVKLYSNSLKCVYLNKTIKILTFYDDVVLTKVKTMLKGFKLVLKIF